MDAKFWQTFHVYPSCFSFVSKSSCGIWTEHVQQYQIFAHGVFKLFILPEDTSKTYFAIMLWDIWTRAITTRVSQCCQQAVICLSFIGRQLYNWLIRIDKSSNQQFCNRQKFSKTCKHYVPKLHTTKFFLVNPLNVFDFMLVLKLCETRI